MKKRMLFVTLACAVVAFSLLAGCSAQNQQGSATSTETSLADALAPALQAAGYGDYVGGKTYETGLIKNEQGMPVYDSVPLVKGYFAATKADFDGDGSDEVLVLATDSAQGKTDTGFGTNTVKFMMFENENNNWSLAADYTIDNVLLIDNGRFDVFYQTKDKQTTIFVENCFASSSAADGLCYNLYPITYTDGKLQQSGDILSFAGSAELDRYLSLNLNAKQNGASGSNQDLAVTEDETNFVNGFNAWGFAVKEIGLDKPVMENDTSLTKVGRIQTSLTASNEQLAAFYNDSAQKEIVTTKVELIDYTK